MIRPRMALPGRNRRPARLADVVILCPDQCDAGEDGDDALGTGTQSVCAESRPVEEKSPRLANQYGGLGGRSDPLAESLAFGQAKHAGLVHVLNCIDC